jgi:hypothetical protein
MSFAVKSFPVTASEQARFLAAAGVLDRVIGEKAMVLAAKPRKPPKPILLPLRLVESPGASGTAVVSGKLTARAKLKLDIGANGSIEQTVKANKKGMFQFTFYVGYGTTPVEVIGPNSGKRPRIGELNVVRRDTNPPLLSISALAPGTLSHTEVTITGLARDSETGLNSVRVAIDGGTLQPLALSASGAFAYTTTLSLNGSADGAHQIRFLATDQSGNSTSATASFTFDTRPPSITVTSPSAGAQVSTSPNVTGQVSDALSGVATLQGQVDSGAFSTIPVGATGSFSFATGLATDSNADGPHSVTLRATDRAGNVATTELDFTLETSQSQPPTITIQSPAAGLSFKIDPTISGMVSGTDVISLQAQVDSLAQVSVSFDASSGEFTFTPSLALDGSAEGQHTVAFKAMDSAGNTTITDFHFSIDTIPPAQPTVALAVADRENGSALSTTNSAVTLTGQTSANVSLEIVQTGATALSTNTGAFQFPGVPVSLGDNSLTIVAMDMAGNTSQNQTTIHRDASTGGTNQVILWDEITLLAIEQDGSAAEVAARALAIMSASVYDAVNSIDATPGYYVKLTAPFDASPDAAVASAAYTALSYLYPAQQAFLNTSLTNALASVPSGQSKADGESVGQSVANAIIAMRQNDGSTDFVDYTPGSAPGDWQPTAPAFAPAENPQWATLKPFAMTSDSQFRPAGPPALTSQEYADEVNETLNLGSVNSTTRTADETQIAKFWNDNPGTYTPPGHWNSIADAVVQQQGDSLSQDARVFAELNIALGDAAIVAWDAKYAYNAWRPITLADGGGTAVNSAIETIANWAPEVTTPPFPEYVSGHSTFSGAAAAVLTAIFGNNYSFTATSVGLPGVTRSYTSFDQAADEAGMSRIYGGIHFLFSDLDGLASGQALGNYVLQTFTVSQDTTPPQVTLNNVLPNGASNKNVTITGFVTDNLSGVAALAVSVDAGAYAPLSFNLMSGALSFTTGFATDGSQDGSHTVDFQATDVAGNVASPVAFTFTLGTKAPTLILTSPTEGGALAAGATLIGTVTTSGPALSMLNYAFDGGTVMPLAFNSDGTFSQALDLSALAAGNHTLVVTAMDAAGNTQTQTLHLTQPTAIPLTVTALTPAVGSSDVGVTFRPVVTFSRPIDTTTLNSSNFYATDTTGAVIPATVVPSDDGTFAWLFFTNPMPGASTITITVDGSTIKAADGSLLDAAGSGTPGSELSQQFTTVSSSAVPGTTLSGIVADPGADDKPGTTDDVKSGPDGILMTGDDIYLNPIAGATVYILGQENQAVISVANGSFSLTSVPSGDVKLVIDGRTATSAPSGVFYPEMVFDLTINPGAANTVMGSMGTTQEQAAEGTAMGVYLPRLQSSILKPAGGSTATTISLGPDAAQGLTPAQASGYSITVAPNSLVGMDGTKMSSGMVGFQTVAPALIRPMLPQGVMQLATTLTIQAPGVATFSTPLQVTFANVYGAAPGSQLDVYSFNHTTGLLEITGTATVSADGKTATTDPGSGITHPGWFGVTPPGACGGSGGPPVTPSSSPDDQPPVVLPLGILADVDPPSGFMTLTWNAPTGNSTTSCSMPQAFVTVQIEIDGPLADYATPTGTQLFTNPGFTLHSGESPRTFGFDYKSWRDIFSAPDIPPDQNVLFGTKIKITEIDGDGKGETQTKIMTFYAYALFDSTDDNHNDDTISFPKTLVGVQRPLPLFEEMPADAKPSLDTPYPFTSDGANIVFTPGASGSIDENLTIRPPVGGSSLIVKMHGQAVDPTHWSVDTDALASALEVAYNDNGVMTGDEKAMFEDGSGMFSLSAATQLASDVVSYAAGLLNKFSPALVEGTGSNAIVMNNFSANLFDPREVYLNALGALGYTPTGTDVNANAIQQIFQNASNETPAEQVYQLSQAINTNPNKLSKIYPTNFFISLHSNPTLYGPEWTRAELVQSMGKNIAHEIGHSLGLVHTWTKNGGGFSQDDVMSQDAGLPNPQYFTFTKQAMTVAVGGAYTVDDGLSALDYYLQAAGYGYLKADSADLIGGGTGDTGEQVPTFDGGLLGILDDTGMLAVSNESFGSVDIGKVASRTFTIGNFGTQPVTIESVSLVTVAASFSVTGLQAGDVIEPNSLKSFTLAFDPTVAGDVSETLVIDDNGLTPTHSLQMSGEGHTTSPHLTLAVANNNLGGTAVGASVHSANLGTITNYGAGPLTISSIHIDAGGSSFTLVGLPPDLGDDPITLATGQTFTFGIQYTASKVGLERAKIEVDSNDPDQPAETFGVMGTGLASVVYPHWGNDYVTIEFPKLNSSVALRTVSDATGNFSFFLPSDQFYHIAIFDPITGLIANGYGTTPPSGQGIDLTSSLVFGPSAAKDTDYDGLPDDVEFAVGTSPTNAYTAGDGIDDFAHVIIDQTNPTGLVPLTTGVVATLPLQGGAQAVTLEGSLQSSQGLTAYVATGTYGLAIVDASQFQKPIALGQVALPGNSVDVSVDPTLQIAAVASTTSLNLVDVSDPTHPRLLSPLDIAAGAVKVSDGVAYAAVGNEVIAVDLVTATILATESFSGGQVDDLGIDQGNLYVLASAGTVSHTVYKVVLDGVDLPSPVESLTITGHPTFGRMRLFAADGYVYVGGSDNNDSQQIPGVEVLEDSGGSLTLIGPPSAITAFDVTTNGSGLALFTGASPGLQTTAQVGLLDLSDPTNTGQVLTVFKTPGAAQSVVTADGLGFVAGSAGLAILSYLPFDTKGIPPKVSISSPVTDADPTTPGIQVLEGSNVPIVVAASDDVQVHDVELLVNGQVVARAVSAPFDFEAQVPTLASGATSVTIEVRATDTGGNSTLSNVLTYGLRTDKVPPTIVRTFPAGGQVVASTKLVTVTFDKEIDPSFFSLSGITLTASGVPVHPVDIRSVFNRELILDLPSSAPRGIYQLTIDPSIVVDQAGNHMAAPYVLTFTIGIPHVINTTPLPDSTSTPPVTTVQLSFDAPLDTSKPNTSDFSIVSPGPDHAFGTADDVSVAIASLAFNAKGDLLTLTLAAPLKPDTYELTVNSADVLDRDGVALDGEFNGTFPSGDGVPGGKFVEQFSVSAGNTSLPFDAFPASRFPSVNSLSFPELESSPYGGYSPILATDLNGDGLLDVVRTVQGTYFTGFNGGQQQFSPVNLVSILYGQTGGGFGNPLILTVGDDPARVVAGDLNGDGIPDLIVLDNPGNVNDEEPFSLSVLLSSGNGFEPAQEIDPGFASNEPGSIVLGDFTGHGRLDLAVLVPGQPDFGPTRPERKTALMVFPGNGDGTFGAPIVSMLDTDSGEHQLAAADLNNDGKLDLVSTLHVFLGHGDGTFNVLPFAGGDGFLALADFTGDGTIDAATGTPEVFDPVTGSEIDATEVQILRGNRDGTFQPLTALTVPISTDSEIIGIGGNGVVADLNGDGSPDLVFSGQASDVTPQGSVAVLLNPGNGMFAGATVLPIFNDAAGYPAPVSVEVGDNDGDGKLDLFLGLGPSEDGGSNTVVVLGNGDATFQTPDYDPAQLGLPTSTGTFTRVLADVNGDGIPDLIELSFGYGSYGNSPSTLGIAFGVGDGSFSALNTVADLPIGTGVLVGDLNGDQVPDLIVWDKGNENDNIRILLGEGGGNFGSPQSLTDTTTGLTDVALEDLDNDGKLDLVLVPATGGIVARLGNGDGTFGPEIVSDYNTSHILGGMVVFGDFNQDGKLDVVSASGIATGNGDGTFTFKSAFPYELGSSLVAADVNGDGKLDLISSSRIGYTILLGNGDGTFQAPQEFTPAEDAVHDIQGADLNGDGIVDLVIDFFSEVDVLIGNGDGTFQAPIRINDPGRALTPNSPILAKSLIADLNRDGLLDIIAGDSIFLQKKKS